jgi:hypothetical protein
MITTEALGGVASGYGMYKGAKGVGSMLRKRKSKRMSSNSKSKSKSKKSGPWHSDDNNQKQHHQGLLNQRQERQQ